MNAFQIPGAALAADARSVDALRSTAARDPQAAVREAAKQFESLFMQELLKSMRKATLASGMLDNAGSQLGTEMLDAQFATKMAGQPGGLSDAIVRQLGRQIGSAEAAARPAATAGAPAAASQAGGAAAPRIPTKQAAFVQQHDAAAKAAEAATGIPAAFLVAQAAHESGWGRHEIRTADGRSSHNLFGIKAGSGWKGPVAEITTTEYVGGRPRKVTARFRAYASYDEAFKDYARLMTENPRYRGVVARAAVAPANAASGARFAAGLQSAGYATDPAYATKLSRLINSTLRLQRAVA